MTGSRPVVAVVGGGISGLSSAWELCRVPGAAHPDGIEVHVFEAGAPGGKLRTESFADRMVDVGPDAFVTRRPEATELCRQLGLENDLVAPATGVAYLWRSGRLRRLPSGLALGVPTRLGPVVRSRILSPAGVARAAMDLLAPPKPGSSPAAGSDRSVGDIVGRRLGRQVVERLADPLIGGIHAGGVEHMSSAAVFPALLEASGRPGSLMRNLGQGAVAPPGKSTAPAVFLGVSGGMGRLVERLVRELEKRRVELRDRCPVHALERRGKRWLIRRGDGLVLEADAVVLAVPAPVTARLIRPHHAGLAGRLDAVSYASVVVVTMSFDAASAGPLPPGSGFLVPRAGGGLVTACTWMSSKWPALARPGELLIRASLGRHGDDRAADMDDDDLVERAAAELAPAIGGRGLPLRSLVSRHPSAFPQYSVGHLEAVAAMEQAAAGLGGLALAGAALQGVGIPACVASGRRAARAAVSHLEEPAWR